MKKTSRAQISESEESDQESIPPQPTPAKDLRSINNVESSSSSSDFEESRRPPTPPKPIQKKKSTPSPKKNVIINPLEKFILENEDLTKLTVSAAITEEDDVCLMELPKTLDPTHFSEKLINFDKRTKIKVHNTKYIIEPEIEDSRSVNLLTQGLRIIHPISVLKLRQRNKHKHLSEVVDVPTSPPVLPKKLKVRHPLFGSEYKRKIVLSAEIQHKLDNAIEKALKKMKKKSDKKGQEMQLDVIESRKKTKQKKQALKTEQDIVENEDAAESIFTLLTTHIEKKKEKRDKHDLKEKTTGARNFVGSEDNNGSVYRSHKNSLRNADFKEERSKHKNNVKEERSTQNLDFSDMEAGSMKRRHKNSTHKEIQHELELTGSGVSFEDIAHTNSLKKHSIKEEETSKKNSIKQGRSSQNLDFSDIEAGSMKRKHKKSINKEIHHEFEFTRTGSSFEDIGHRNNLKEEKVSKKNSVKQERSSQNLDFSDVEADSMKRKHKKSINREMQHELEPTRSGSTFDDISHINSLQEHSIKEEKVSKKNSVKQERGSQNIDFSDMEMDSIKKKHKKKQKHSINEEHVKSKHEEETEFSGSWLGDSESERKNKKSSIVNSTVISELQLPLFEFDVSDIVNKDDSKNGDHIQDRIKREKSVEPQNSRKNRKIKQEPFNESDDGDSFKEKTHDANFEEGEWKKSQKKKIKQESFDSEYEGSSPKKRKKTYDTDVEENIRKKVKKTKKEKEDPD